MAKDFTFKQFHINAYQCGMPISTDAILLGAWSNIEQAKSILDIGSGTGILSIMAAQRNIHAEIVAVEIEQNAINATKQNFQNCPWEERLSAYHVSIEDFAGQNKTFKAIVCNPPYFNDGEKSSNDQRAIARHTSSLSHLNLILICERLLASKGMAHFILPTQEGEALIGHVKNIKSIQLIKLCYVQTTLNKKPSRILMSFIKTNEIYEVKPDRLVVHEGNSYSKQFIQLTEAFYLKM